MENYLVLNGTKIELTESQVQEIKGSFGSKLVKLSEFKPGEIVRIGRYEFIVLEQSGDTTAVIMKDLLKERVTFGKNNNYDGSNVDDICNKFAKTMIKAVGDDNVIEFTVDLTSDDGLKDYGKIKRKAALLTCELYRRYVYILDKFKPDKWWWLATAYSTPSHDNTRWAKCVSPDGYFDCFDYNYYYGVRPVLTFVSDISVSCED